MEVDGGDPSSVNKNPGIIKAAQEEIASLDILVCGRCNYVYHFIEEFQEHKNGKTCGKPTFKANLSESKPQVWAFLLWKSSIVSKHKTSGNKDPINSWKLYQQWCRMNEKVRDAWIVAGRNIQQFSILANAKIAEVHSKKGTPEMKPKIISTRSLLIEDEDASGDKKNEKMPVTDPATGLETVRKIVRIPSEKGASLKEARVVSTVQANKDVRTYSPKKLNESEESIEDVNNAIITNSDGTEENESPEELSSKTEDLKETTDEVAKAAESEKETERTEQDDTSPSRTVEKTLVNDPLGDGMVEIKVENASSEDEQEHMDVQEEREKVPPEQETEQQPAEQPPKIVPRKPLATNRAIRTRKPGDRPKEGDASSEDEYVVEKILAKRFNPKKKCFEYLLKWEGYPHDQNTWEPVDNMAACDKLVETFEANLAKQRAANQRGMGASKPALQPRPVKVVKNSKPEVDVNQPGPSGVNTFESRPVRSSKKRAMEQVKSWCGTMQRKEFEIGKRKFGEESDTDDDFDVLPSEKKIKLEPPDEEWSGAEMDATINSPQSSEEEGTEKKKKLTVVAVQGNQSRVVGTVHRSGKSLSHAGEEVIKRGPGRPPKRLQALESNTTVNGITKSKTSVSEKDLAVELGLASDSSPEHKAKPAQSAIKLSSSQPPVLVANSKGVIKVDPRQVPNLTSGVYIVSNKSGIVKLDSAPGSPVKDKTSEARQSPQGQSPGTAGVIINKSGIQTGIVRKPLSPSSTVVRSLGQNSLKQGTKPAVSLKSPLNTTSGLVKVSSMNNKLTPGLPPRLGTPTRPLLMSPRVLGSRPSLSSPRPLSMLSQRPGLLQSVRPGLTPRMPGMPLRPSLGNALKKSSIGVPGIQTKITSAVRPKTPLQAATGRGLSKAPSPAAQVKSGIKPIQAMLGKAVQQNSASNNSLAPHRLILPKKQPPGSGALVSTTAGTVKPGVKAEDPKLKKGGGRGRGRGLADGATSVGRAKDSKLVENNGLHMEFHEVNSSSDSDDGFDSLPELPMGELPPLEPESPPRPFTLCPETGKILGQAEGEPTPVPSPEPEVKPKEEPEEIVSEKQESPSMEASPENSQENQESEKETVLKLEMSPGGTTGTVIESNTVPSTYVDTLRTQEGLTVTKISTTSTSPSDSQQQGVVSTSKVGGGISVPAKKLFVDSSSSNNDVSVGGNNSALNAEMVAITGEDGMVYHIATEEEHDGETMIVSTDGNQCVYVTAEQAAGLEEGSVLTLDSAVAEAVAQLMPDQVNVIGGGTAGCSQFYVKEGDGDSSQLMISSDVDQSEETTHAQIIAQVVQEAEPIAETGGTRRVVLLLPDGNLMMTEVDEEQYAALNIENDK